MRIASKTAVASESMHKRYVPVKVCLLFVGESPPASGRLFYHADSGLYRAIRETFIAAFPAMAARDFLAAFSSLGCYLVDLSATPVDRLPAALRKKACTAGEARLRKTIKQFQPKIIITLVRSIAPHVERSLNQTNWRGAHLALPYPGRWHHHRAAFKSALIPLLQRELQAISSTTLRQDTSRRNESSS